MSEQNLVDCTMTSPYNNLGCGGGDPYMAYYYIYNNKGVDTSVCYPVSNKLALPLFILIVSN